MEAIRSSKPSVHTRSTRHHIPEDSILLLRKAATQKMADSARMMMTMVMMIMMIMMIILRIVSAVINLSAYVTFLIV
jgi:hypothetical protein